VEGDDCGMMNRMGLWVVGSILVGIGREIDKDELIVVKIKFSYIISKRCIRFFHIFYNLGSSSC
jgi:hypothetical protein